LELYFKTKCTYHGYGKEDMQAKDIGNIFEKLITEKFPNLDKEISI
jgi:hypothetical protein